jgi:hypothetical protein
MKFGQFLEKVVFKWSAKMNVAHSSKKLHFRMPSLNSIQRFSRLFAPLFVEFAVFFHSTPTHTKGGQLFGGAGRGTAEAFPAN